MDFLATLFLFGTVGFWLLCVPAVILLLAFVETGQSFGALVVLLVTAVLLWTCGNSEALRPFLSLRVLLIGGGLYIAAGGFWSLWKWYLFARDRKEQFIEHRTSWMVTRPAEDYKRFLKDNRHLLDRFGPPEPSQHKQRITHWMAYWPFSAINFVCFDFFRRVFQHVYLVLAEVFRKISRSVYGEDLMKDVE